MILLKRAVALTLILPVVCLYFPAAGFSSTETDKQITQHPVNFSALPMEQIPVETVEKKKISKWVWIGLGVLAAGGIAAAAAGGSGGGDDPEPAPEGGIEVTW